ncbi:hypothetical protein MTO96_028830 [Rhipicephalus appendiculatus]
MQDGIRLPKAVLPVDVAEDRKRSRSHAARWLRVKRLERVSATGACLCCLHNISPFRGDVCPARYLLRNWCPTCHFLSVTPWAFASPPRWVSAATMRSSDTSKK